MSDIVERLSAANRCARCQCPDCGRGADDELHNHVCTYGLGCVDTVQQLRRRVADRNILCSQAAIEIRRLRRENRSDD